MTMDLSALLALAACLVVSLTALICYGRDKKLAREHKWRMPEHLLLCLGFFGGAAGALAGMLLFRHKTKHWYFWVINIAGLIWQAVFLIYMMATSNQMVEYILNTR